MYSLNNVHLSLPTSPLSRKRSWSSLHLFLSLVNLIKLSGEIKEFARRPTFQLFILIVLSDRNQDGWYKRLTPEAS